MLSSETDPESYVKEYTPIYEEYESPITCAARRSSNLRPTHTRISPGILSHTKNKRASEPVSGREESLRTCAAR